MESGNALHVEKNGEKKLFYLYLYFRQEVTKQVILGPGTVWRDILKLEI